MISKRQLYAMGEPLGDSATSYKPGGRVYGGGGSGGGNSSYVVEQLTSTVDPASGTRNYSDGTSVQMSPEELYAWQLFQRPGFLPSFDVGTNYVPKDMLARIHEGEAIVPKAYNPWANGQSMQGGDPELLAEMRANHVAANAWMLAPSSAARESMTRESV